MARTTTRLPSWFNRKKAAKIVLLRGLGYDQQDIAPKVGLSASTVSRYLQTLRDESILTDSESLYWTLMGPSFLRFLQRVLKE